MFNVDDWANRGVGVLRACGRAGDRAEIACTPWARVTWNAGDRRFLAIARERYGWTIGLFPLQPPRSDKEEPGYRLGIA